LAATVICHDVEFTARPLGKQIFVSKPAVWAKVTLAGNSCSASTVCVANFQVVLAVRIHRPECFTARRRQQVCWVVIVVEVLITEIVIDVHATVYVHVKCTVGVTLVTIDPGSAR